MLSKKGVMGLTFKKGFPFLWKRVSDYCMLRGLRDAVNLAEL